MEPTVAVIGRVREAAGDVAGALDHEWFAVPVHAAHHGPARTWHVHGGARHGEAALRLVEEPPARGAERIQDRVDDVPDVPHPVVIGALITTEHPGRSQEQSGHAGPSTSTPGHAVTIRA